MHTIKDLYNAKFTRITNTSVTKIHPHDTTISSETPTYSRENNSEALICELIMNNFIRIEFKFEYKVITLRI